MKNIFYTAVIIFSLVMSPIVAGAQVASGGNFTLEQSVVAGGGGQSSTGGTFSLDGTIGQAAAGGALNGSPFAVTSGFWNFTPSAPIGFEADVSPRPGGDGFIDADDIQQIRRFAVGLDMPYQSNEAQRTDNSPRSLFGDGFVDSDDVEQARRYSVGFDLKQTTNGPTPANAPNSTAPELQAEASSKLSESGTKLLAGRAVRVVNKFTSVGSQVTVPINVDTSGDETGYTFSLTYDSTKLTNPVVSIGELGGNQLSNTATAGQIGFSVTSFAGPNGTIAEVTDKTLVNVRFDVAAVAGTTTDLVFGDTPARRKVSGIDPNTPLPQPTYTNGTVTISGPTATTVSVGGRVLTAQGRGIRNVVITMTDSQGNVRTATSTSFGYYQFDAVAAGETYIFTARGKRFTFARDTIVRSITEDTNSINFVANDQSLTPLN